MRDQKLLNALLGLVVDDVTTIESHVGQRNFDQFLDDRMARDAALFRFIRIGETCDMILAKYDDRLDASLAPLISEASSVGSNVVRDHFKNDFTSLWDDIHVMLPDLKRQSLRFIK